MSYAPTTSIHYDIFVLISKLEGYQNTSRVRDVLNTLLPLTSVNNCRQFYKYNVMSFFFQYQTNYSLINYKTLPSNYIIYIILFSFNFYKMCKNANSKKFISIQNVK